MKKTMALACSTLLLLGLTACGNDKDSAKDGVYTAQTTDSYAQENSNGFRDVLKVTYENGNIVAVDFDSYDLESGTSKLDLDYPMDPPPSQWFGELEDAILNNGKVDTIAGATNTSGTAKKLLDAIEKDGVAGGTVEVDS